MFVVMMLLSFVPGATVPIAEAQTGQGTIRGSIRDETGAVVPGVIVTAMSLGTDRAEARRPFPLRRHHPPRTREPEDSG